MPNQEDVLRKALLEFIHGENAHAGLRDAVKDFPAAQYAKKPADTPHNAWQLVEHIRITLHDLVEFCRNPDYSAPAWPQGYWPQNEAPANTEEWNASVKSLLDDVRQMEHIVEDRGIDLFAKIPWGDGQTVLREILLAGDHTSYHVGQLILLRKQLGVWKS